jgi:TRAP-type C4-dicarboxylate transport system substrate-binding protein
MLKGIVYLVAMASISSAQAQSVTLDLINEYPATAISGEADAFFADAVKRRSEGRIAVNLNPGCARAISSRR